METDGHKDDFFCYMPWHIFHAPHTDDNKELSSTIHWNNIHHVTFHNMAQLCVIFILFVVNKLINTCCGITHPQCAESKIQLKLLYIYNCCVIFLFVKLGMGDSTTCVYQFIYNEKDKNDTQITQYFIMHGLGYCIQVDSYVAHLFYAW